MQYLSRPVRFWLYIGVVVFISALITSRASAQQTGEITGAVTDSSGAVIPGASVTVTNTATRQKRLGKSNASGLYNILFLQPGLYDVLVENAGFTSQERKGIDVQVGNSARVDISMPVGGASQSVTVSAGAALIDAESTSLGSVFESDKITQLPLNGRDYTQLVGLAPNVVMEAPITGTNGGSTTLQGGVRSLTSISVAGQRLELNHYTLDGVENTDPNFNSYIVHPTIDAIQEFKVLTGVYPAEFGEGASQINVTTLPGGTKYHLVAFEFLRNPYADALPWHAPTFRNTLKQNDYGFTLSGPIPFFDRLIDSKKLFFMSNFEGDHTRQTAPYTASVPTTAMRGGDLSSLGVNIYDPATRVYTSSTTGTATQYPGNIIPTTAGSGFTPISQQALAILSYLPKPNVCDTSLSCGVGYNYQNGVATPIDSSNFTQRVDFSQSENVSWFARYSWENDNEIIATDPFVFDSLKVPTTTNQAVLANTWVISPTAVNEVRLGWSEFLNDKTDYFANKTNVQATLGISGLAAPSPVGWGLPGLTLGGGITNFGNSGAWHLADELYHASDSFSLVRGRHTFKFGGEFGRDRFNEEGNQTSSGGFTFDGASTSNPGITGTGSILADLLVGHPSTSVRVVSYSDIQLRRPDYAVFAQDNWKATSKITVNGGLRYENYRPWVDKHDNLINPQLFTTGVTTGPWPGLGQTPVSTLNTSIKQPILTRPGSGDFYDGLGFRYATGQNVQRGNQYLGRALVNASDLNFGPRVGVSYSPNQKLALRAGYGIYFAHDIGYPWFDMGRDLGGKDTVNAPVTARNVTLAAPWASEANPANCPGWTGPCLVKPQIQGVAPNNKTSYVEQYIFSIQQQLGNTLAVEVGYLGNEGHKLGRELVFNQAVPKSGPSDTSSVASRTPFPNYGVFQTEVNVVNSVYNSGYLKVTQQPWHGLSYTASLTLGRAIDDGSAVRADGSDYFIPANSYNLRGERGPSQFNVPRRLVASYNYAFPFGKGQEFLNRGVVSQIVGHWQSGGILTLADGSPWYWTRLGDTASINAANGNMPDATGISPIPAHRSWSHFWNPAAANYTAADLSYKVGSMGRGTLTTPGTTEFDASLIRDFSFTERQHLNLRFEAFNVLNHPNWNVPSPDPRNLSTFGVVTSARAMRELQLAAKYSF